MGQKLEQMQRRLTAPSQCFYKLETWTNKRGGEEEEEEERHRWGVGLVGQEVNVRSSSLSHLGPSLSTPFKSPPFPISLPLWWNNSVNYRFKWRVRNFNYQVNCKWVIFEIKLKSYPKSNLTHIQGNTGLNFTKFWSSTVDESMEPKKKRKTFGWYFMIYGS